MHICNEELPLRAAVVNYFFTSYTPFSIDFKVDLQTSFPESSSKYIGN